MAHLLSKQFIFKDDLNESFRRIELEKSRDRKSNMQTNN